MPPSRYCIEIVSEADVVWSEAETIVKIKEPIEREFDSLERECFRRFHWHRGVANK